MRVVHTVAALRAALATHRRAGRIGFVPTMGALHAGHVALFERARHDGDHVVASVFVNPTQFNDPADLAAYPRQTDADAALAAAAGVDTLFLPEAADVFRPGHATTVHAEGVALGFEGGFRPGHFDGVALVCLKLFGMVRPHQAYFGQKDAQQVAVIRQLVRDLDVDLEIRVVPTVRDPRGLALSSRNARLSAAEREQALVIPAALKAGLGAFRDGADPALAARRRIEAGSVALDYAEVAPFPDGPTLVVAVRIGTTRLIDNVPLERPELAGLADASTPGPRSS